MSNNINVVLSSNNNPFIIRNTGALPAYFVKTASDVVMADTTNGNILTYYSNGSFVLGVPASVSNAQLASNLANYLTLSGVAANVLVNTSNNSNYLQGRQWSTPGALGSATANTGNFTNANALSFTIGSDVVSNTTGIYAPIVVANTFVEKLNAITASATPVVLTSSSPQNILVTGSVSQVFNLPNATTLVPGWTFKFNNNAGTNGLQIYAADGTTSVAYIQQGAYVEVILLTNTTGNGTWDTHANIPNQIGWGNNNLSMANTPIIGTGSITPQVNNALNVGSAVLQYSAVYANNGWFTGTVNAVVYSVGTTFIANTTQLTINGNPLSANGGVGSVGQVLTSNGTTGAPFWSNGAATSNTRSVTSNYTLSLTDDFILAGNTTTMNVTLVAASINTGRKFYIQNANTGTLTILPNGSDTIGGQANLILLYQRSLIGLVAIGTDWVKF